MALHIFPTFFIYFSKNIEVNMTKFFMPIILTVSLALTSCSSSTQTPATKHIVTALCENEAGLPAGMLYSSDKTDGGIPDTLLPSYFGVTDIEKYSKEWLSVSIFLAGRDSPCEFAVIYCATPECLKDTSRMLLARIDSRKKLVDSDGYDSRVINIKSYAILICSRDTKAALKAIKKALK